MKQQIIERFPGIGCAWADAAGKENAEYWGFADRENQVFVDENTVFPACSISKFVTAICVMKLHEQKLIDIDLPANQYLHRWKLLTVEGTRSDASIRSILSHTAGIVDGEEAFSGLRRGDPSVSLEDILEGRTAYNRRPARAEKPQGTAFEYSDAGYCVLQQLLQEAGRQAFEEIAREIVFDPLALKSTFFASSGNAARFENRMAAGYDESFLPIPGRFPPVPDLAASGLWSTPKELLGIAGEFVKALHGESAFLKAGSAREMARPAKDFPWTGLGVFTGGEDILISQGWGENGQCMMKMNCRTKEISVVMTNRNPGADQTESGIEWLVNMRFADQ
ncbi:MAG: beta-lactamase family protein [Clostridia bacterium]|nr:beta-lactamase family protein [Clostridia bacterium]